MLTFIESSTIQDMDFVTWLKSELDKRDWTATDLARQAGLGNSTVTRILSGERNAGADVCAKIAEALGERPEEVFRMAGLLPPPFEEESRLNGEEMELVNKYRELGRSRKGVILSIIRDMAEQARRRRQ